MDSDEFRAILLRSGARIWDVIEAAVRVAVSDYGNELRSRRDGIIESLYAQVCRSCGRAMGEDGDREHAFCTRSNVKIDINGSDDMENDKDSKKFDNDELKSNRNFNEGYSSSPFTPVSNNRNFSDGEEGEELDPFGGLFDDEQTKILNIKEKLEDQNQDEDIVVELLQTLADMDITFQALKETDIGRYVNRLRKHPSNEVRMLVKQLVRKWKETVDEWVKVHEPQAASNLIGDVDSPQQGTTKYHQNSRHQDGGLSPNPQNGNCAGNEMTPKSLQSASQRDAYSKPPQPFPKSVPNRAQEKEQVLDDNRLLSATKRLQQNYQEAQNAKKQRTIQVMDIHEIPKPKRGFVPKSKGGRLHHW